METVSMRRPSAVGAGAATPGGLGWSALGVSLLFFSLVVYLGLEGGGFDPLVHDQVGIVAWWLLLAAVLAGALPRQRLGAPALAALILFSGLVLWTAFSLIWTESSEQTLADLARIGTYLAIFVLALATRDSRETACALGALAAGITVVVGVALLSRFHPSLFGGAEQTGKLLASEERLSYPLNYWNALASLTAVGIPLLLHFATGARHLASRALAAAALPALMLTLYFTISRGGIAAAAIAVAVFLVFAADRLAKLPVLLIATGAGTFLIALSSHRAALKEGLSTTAAHQQGDEIMWICIVVCLLVGLLAAAFAAIGRSLRRPSWTRPSAEASWAAVAVGVTALIALALALGAPSRASDAWSEFKGNGGPGEGTGRLGSVAGESRYQFWSSAVDENSTAPLIGTGSGTFRYWWARNGDGSETVRDTHSLYLQTLGELGIVGLLLLVGFIGVVLVAGSRNALLGPPGERSLLAAALAGFCAFFLTAAVDWMWQVPVLPAIALLLGALLVTGARASGEKPRLPWVARGAVALLALIAVGTIAMPLAATSLVRDSEAQARRGNLSDALSSARSAQNVEPFAASPRLQQALVLELLGQLPAAENAARAATKRESTNWRLWVVLSRIAAEQGKAATAVDAYEEARALNPHGKIFRR